ncbi:hypothetical protein ACE1CD_17970 [Aerosakkonema sp. BLCC-F183]|uniref:hypothetical protein n=1 Tax=Aerosakkonema sp. BLCC-F183 TaxID=3342834 RepID=UPI0035B8B660
MKLQILAIAILASTIGYGCSIATSQVRQPPVKQTALKVAQEGDRRWDNAQEAAFQLRSLAIREKLAALDLDKLNAWWRREKIGDPHKYLLPVILSRLSLGERYNRQHIWDILMELERERPDLYHFRSVFDIRIFFLFRHKMPANVEASYRSMVESPRMKEWLETGTENHMFMQRLSGLALMDNSGWTVNDPATFSTIEAWLRSELNKFLTIGQGEFHSSTYYGYSIGGLLNLYDFGRTPELRQLAKVGLDWYAANMALRLSWGTAGGAESRGFDRNTWDSGLSAVAWMWWGGEERGSEGAGERGRNYQLPIVVEKMNNGNARLALLAGLSSYRPDPSLRQLARKEVPLPFLAKASHPDYYSYHQDNRFWETFYVTKDYSLATLLEPKRSYQVKGTINAQYATYKLAIRDPKGENNAVISLGGTYHNLMATGRSPGDQYVQGRSAVIYQLILNQQDLAANVPPRSHLVIPIRYGQPQRYRDWYIWQIEETWLLARPWGDKISLLAPVSERNKDYQALVASGNKTAWITDVARIADYPDFKRLTAALDRVVVDDREWEKQGKLAYTGLEGDKLVMTYAPNGGIGVASINGKPRVLQNWPVIASPYLREGLRSGVLEYRNPVGDSWSLRATLNSFQWD